jgi:hypothetical protein
VALLSHDNSRFIFVVAIPFVALVLTGCASLQPQRWPPPAGTPVYPVYVSLDSWHGMIGFPGNTGIEPAMTISEERSRQDITHAEYEEWGYAERQWYVEGQQGSTGKLRALFWPTPGVVEVARYDRLWSERTPQPPADVFLFHVSAEGFARLRRYLLSTLASDEHIARIERSVFFPARRDYHLFHHCHHYVANALKAAGLPVSPFWATSRTLLSQQLVRAKRLAQELMPETAQDAQWPLSD